MSDYARRNLSCSSHHRCPDGWQSWSGMMRGYTSRPFCWDMAGHAGDHTARIETIAQRHNESGALIPVERDVMTWANTLGLPAWLVETTIHGLRMYRDHAYPQDQYRALSVGAAYEAILSGLYDQLSPEERARVQARERVA